MVHIELVLRTKFNSEEHEWWPRKSEIRGSSTLLGQILTVGVPSVMCGGTFGDFLSSKLQIIIFWIVHLAQQEQTQSLRAWEQLNKKSRIASESRAVTMRVACEPSKYVSVSVKFIFEWGVLLIFE